MSAPMVLLMPGASLMDITATDDGVPVRCPGCNEAQLYNAQSGISAAFEHADGCAVHRRIQKAIELYERTAVRRG